MRRWRALAQAELGVLYRDRSSSLMPASLTPASLMPAFHACLSHTCLPQACLTGLGGASLVLTPISGCFSVLHITSSEYLRQHLPPWSCIYTPGELEGQLLQALLLIPLAILGGDLDAQSLWHQLHFSCSTGFGLALSSSLLNLLHCHMVHSCNDANLLHCHTCIHAVV